MLKDLLETRNGGVALGRSAVSTAVLAHGVAFFVLMAASLLAAVSPGEEKLPFPPFMTPHSIPVILGTHRDAGAREGTQAVRRPTSRDERVKTAGETQPVRIEPPSQPQPPADRPFDLATESSPPDSTQESSSDLDGSGEGDGPVGMPGGKGVGDRGTGTDVGTQGDPLGVRDGNPLGRPDEIFEPGGGVETPVLIRRVEPTYPPMAIATRTQGTVILQGVIGTDGKVESLVVLQSSRLLDEAALRAVRQWVYTPARLHGRPVKVYLTIRVVFQLN